MRKLIGILTLLAGLNGWCDTKISQLPLGIPTNVGIDDSFPYVETATGTTKRLKISGLILTPNFGTTFALKQNVLPLTTKGDLLIRSNADVARFGVCPDGQTIQADSTQMLGWKCISVIGVSLTTTTANSTLATLSSNAVVNVDTSLGPISIWLPDAMASSGYFVDVKNVGPNTVTVLTQFGQTLDGASSVQILNKWDTLHVGAVVSQWFEY